MKKFLFSRGGVSVGAVIAACVALPVPAALADSCPATQLTQPFLSYGDSNSYTLAPGESADNFDGTGWVLNGGASLVTTTLDDGTTGQVLDLPPGASATSPTMCVQAGMPLARMMTQVANGPSSKKSEFQVFNADGTLLTDSSAVVAKQGWRLSPAVNVVPAGFSGTAQVSFTISSDANKGDLQVYDLYVDPRMWW